MPTPNKKKVIAAIIQHIQSAMAVINAAIGDAHTAATHEETQAKSKYDTFALESSYLANGQTKRLAELDEALKYFKNILPPSSSQTITHNHLIKLSKEDDSLLYVFLAPCGGGIRVKVDGCAVSVVTPDSPIGESLLGTRIGDVFEIKTKGQTAEYEVLKYWD
ncbi:GreA/GreB family elongation factor [bacterium]|nr:GreA/GreB family elongation factor [bacterium]